MNTYVNTEDVLEYAQVNCEDAGFIMKLTDYLCEAAEEILECKDCRNCEVKFRKAKGEIVAWRRCEKFGMPVETNEFCCWAERKRSKQ